MHGKIQKHQEVTGHDENIPEDYHAEHKYPARGTFRSATAATPAMKAITNHLRMRWSHRQGAGFQDLLRGEKGGRTGLTQESSG